MSIIKVLPKEVAIKIAAGEVVERPASVIKELMENSIDAGATKVLLKVENGGRTLISIEDNGVGMMKEDVEKCILEHATSKINSIEDIYTIGTFGFRGEALSAIASVSKVKIVTKHKEDITATEMVVEGGEIISKNQISSGIGTSIEIKDIFYNIPARLAYLKNDTTEHTHNLKVFLNFALIYPQIDFQFYHNNKLLYDLIATDFINRSKVIFHPDFEDIFIPLQIDRYPIKGTLYVPKMNKVYSKRGDQYIYMNKRYIQDKVIMSAINDSYKSLLANPALRDIPFIADIYCNDVDVNVHPRKMEVKFKDPQLVHQAISFTIKNYFTNNYKIIDNIPNPNYKKPSSLPSSITKQNISMIIVKSLILL